MHPMWRPCCGTSPNRSAAIGHRIRNEWIALQFAICNLQFQIHLLCWSISMRVLVRDMYNRSKKYCIESSIDGSMFSPRCSFISITPCAIVWTTSIWRSRIFTKSRQKLWKNEEEFCTLSLLFVFLVLIALFTFPYLLWLGPIAHIAIIHRNCAHNMKWLCERMAFVTDSRAVERSLSLYLLAERAALCAKRHMISFRMHSVLQKENRKIKRDKTIKSSINRFHNYEYNRNVFFRRMSKLAPEMVLNLTVLWPKYSIRHTHWVHCVAMTNDWLLFV